MCPGVRRRLTHVHGLKTSNADERVDSESWVSRQNEAISRCTLPSEETRMQSASEERGIWIVYTENVRVSLCLRNTH